MRRNDGGGACAGMTAGVHAPNDELRELRMDSGIRRNDGSGGCCGPRTTQEIWSALLFRYRMSVCELHS